MKIELSEIIAQRYNFLTVLEVQALKFWSCMLPENPIVINIGAGAGSSGLAFLEAREDLQLITVDIEAGMGGMGGLGLELLTFKKAGVRGERHEQIAGDSAEVGRNWSRDSVDMVFVDGDHSYDQVCGDIRAWTPHLKENGILCGHDYGFSKYPGVKQAFDELLLSWHRLGLIDHLIAFRGIYAPSDSGN